MRWIELEGGITSTKDAKLHEDLGLDTEPEIIPAMVTLDLDRVEALMESMYNGKVSGCSITLYSGEAFWINMAYKDALKLLKQ